ncbi:hypothetical protein FRAHR75_120019 [Frankia sp. Hr75.2]|nr:hypothetical protein FRAHR75_120019 [Frankia sp. Hr75.2]
MRRRRARLIDEGRAEFGPHRARPSLDHRPETARANDRQADRGPVTLDYEGCRDYTDSTAAWPPAAAASRPGRLR